MKAQRAFLFFILIAASIGIILILSARDPRYRGRSLTSWLEQCSDTPLMETQRLAEAQTAIRAIGARRALPRLLRLIEAKADPVSPWIMAKSAENPNGIPWRIFNSSGSPVLRF
jgi:hypothetical protein